MDEGSAVNWCPMKTGVSFDNITAQMPIIGFTGALGSGCTYLAKGLAEYHGYEYCSLSKYIHWVIEREKVEATSKNLQNIGNALRANHGPDILVRISLEEINQKLAEKKDAAKPVGLVVDGIRNTAEIDALRAWPQFYLVSVQASQELRKRRVLASGDRCANDNEFLEADKRDAEEQKSYGQQVRKCNYLSDIIILNEGKISQHAPLIRQKYIDENIYKKYIMLIERLAKGEQPKESRARQHEALMTAAYVESKRSSCVKRKVGAIIASKDGDIISAGHNDVPDGTSPCIEDERYGWCAREVIQERIGEKLKFCPNCGEEIKIDAQCPACEEKILRFMKRCTKCKEAVDVKHICSKCKTDVFGEFLTGENVERTGKLLDMCRSLHAEENSILNLSKTGVRPPEGSILYSTTFPCNLCANKIVGLGIKTVVYAEPYTMEEAKRIFEEKNITLRRFEGVKSTAYFRFYS